MPDGIPEELRDDKMPHEAYFVKSTLLIGEVRVRLKRVGLRGRILELEARLYDKMEYLSDDARAALFYIAGKPKTRKFTLWYADRMYNAKRRKSDRNIVHSRA